MATYIILSRFSPEAFREPKDFKKLAEQISAKIKSDCPGVKWQGSWAVMGRFDVVESNEAKEVERAAMLSAPMGHSTTETLLATPWKEFLGML